MKISPFKFTDSGIQICSPREAQVYLAYDRSSRVYFYTEKEAKRYVASKKLNIKIIGEPKRGNP